MDPIFHLLLTNLWAKDERYRDEAFAFSVLPDLGFLLIELYLFFYLTARVDYSEAIDGLPPAFLAVYHTLHSPLVFGVAAALAWRLRPSLLPAMSAWGLHILVDIPVHEGAFGTRLLYPLLPDVHVTGLSWGVPAVVAVAYAVLAALYAYSAWRARRRHFAGEAWRPDAWDGLAARADALLKRDRIPEDDARSGDIGGEGGRLPGQD